MNDRFWSFIGLCMKAGKLSVGDGRATEAVRNNKAYLVLLSLDASGNTEKKFTDMCRYRDIKLLRPGGREELGAALGKDFVVAAAVEDEGFAKRILELAERVDVNNGKNTGL